MNKTGNFSKVQRMVILAVLIALTLVMALTPLGYLKIGALSISFLCIPIAIGATVLGPTAGLILGTLFVQCFGMDAFGTAMLSINWFYTFIICVVARALMGWFTGLIAKGLGKVFEGKTVGKFNLNDLIATILCPVMNTAFFLGFMAILFGSIEVMGLNVITAVVIPALSINCILEIIACFVVGSAVSIAVKKIVAANKSK